MKAEDEGAWGRENSGCKEGRGRNKGAEPWRGCGHGEDGATVRGGASLPREANLALSRAAGRKQQFRDFQRLASTFVTTSPPFLTSYEH